jgi:hydroxyacylglutathione hydrolase
VVGSLQYGLSGPLDCHVYAIRAPNGGVVLIDAGAGTDTNTILENLRLDFETDEVSSLIITHGHFDHCGGAASIRAKTGCRVFASELTRRILEKGDEIASGLQVAKNQGIYPPDVEFTPCAVDVTLRCSERFETAGLFWQAILVRGHSADSACFLLQANGKKFLFSADVVFYGGILGLINAEGSDMRGYRDDLRKLSGLGIDALFPGHGLFTLRDGQRHIDIAVEQLGRGFIPRQIGQGDLIF